MKRVKLMYEPVDKKDMDSFREAVNSNQEVRSQLFDCDTYFQSKKMFSMDDEVDSRGKALTDSVFNIGAASGIAVREYIATLL